MADEHDLGERLDQIARRAQYLRDVLHDGDEFLLGRDHGEVFVEPHLQGDLRTRHPRLYGRLASVEAQLETGCLLYLVALVGLAALVLALRLHWWDAWLGASVVDELNAWWFYLGLFAATAYLVHVVYERIKGRIYRRHRDELLAIAQAEGLERDTLLPLLEDAENLGAVGLQLKLDPGPFPTPVTRPRLVGDDAEELS